MHSIYLCKRYAVKYKSSKISCHGPSSPISTKHLDGVCECGAIRSHAAWCGLLVCRAENSDNLPNNMIFVHHQARRNDWLLHAPSLHHTTLQTRREHCLQEASGKRTNILPESGT